MQSACGQEVCSFSGALRVEIPEHAELENGVHCRLGCVRIYL